MLTERPINLEDVTRAIRSMAKGKSPGPDDLPAEFYQSIEASVAPVLLSVFSEAHTNERMPTCFLDGEMALLSTVHTVQVNTVYLGWVGAPAPTLLLK